VEPPPPPPPAGSITLNVTGRSDATKQYMTLTWSGARGTRVDMYRNGVFRTNTPNDGRQNSNRLWTKPATYIYKICEAGTYRCSNPASIQFGGGPLPANKAPIVVFAPSCTNQSCSFTDGSVDLDGTLTSWQWNFGDGSTSVLQSPTHNYAADGTYTVTLTTTDNRGARKSGVQQVTVAGPPPPPANTPPTAAFTPSCTDLDCGFTDGSTDDGTVTAWSWDFGDGTSSTEPSPTHSYTGAGSYPVTLVVTDDDDATGTVTQTVEVTAPVAAAVAP
jgi:PKD repeat protein